MYVVCTVRKTRIRSFRRMSTNIRRCVGSALHHLYDDDDDGKIGRAVITSTLYIVMGDSRVNR